jgi:predicted MFS family arabinose efflux permease
MTSAFTLALLVALGEVRIWHVLALSSLTGTAQAFGGPAYQSLLPALVERKDLPTAIAFNSIQFNLARVIGPLAAGLALAAFGSAACFGLNGASFLAVVVALLVVRLPRTAPPPPRPITHELREGLAHVRHERSLLVYMALAFVTTSLGTSVLTLMPLLVQQVFGGGAGDYSRMMAFSGAGAVTGALVSAGLGRHPRMGRMTLIGQTVLGTLIGALALSRVMLASEVLLFLVGVALIIVYSALQSLVQLTASDQMRGRVMSIYLMAFRGGMPVGALASGYLAALTSAPTALLANGVLLVLVSVFALRRSPGIDRTM